MTTCQFEDYFLATNKSWVYALQWPSKEASHRKQNWIPAIISPAIKLLVGVNIWKTQRPKCPPEPLWERNKEVSLMWLTRLDSRSGTNHWTEQRGSIVVSFTRNILIEGYQIRAWWKQTKEEWEARHRESKAGMLPRLSWFEEKLKCQSAEPEVGLRKKWLLLMKIWKKAQKHANGMISKWGVWLECCPWASEWRWGPETLYRTIAVTDRQEVE